MKTKPLRADITNHAFDRIRERYKLNKKAIQRFSDEALRYGISHKDTTGRLKKFVDSQFFYHGTGNNTKIHNRHVFIFDGNKLITVYRLPARFHKTEDKIKKRIKPNSH